MKQYRSYIFIAILLIALVVVYSQSYRKTETVPQIPETYVDYPHIDTVPIYQNTAGKE